MHRILLVLTPSGGGAPTGSPMYSLGRAASD
jgi:hypothetical protein